MSNVMDELAEITRARQERERLELESRHDVEHLLFLATNRTPDYDLIFWVARLRGRYLVTENGRPVATVVYAPGRYSVMSPNYSQEG